MKKLVLAVIVVVLMSTTGWAALSWGYSGNLLDWDVAMQEGWLVQMYQDVNSDTSVGSITNFYAGAVKGVASGGNSSDDVLLLSYTDTLELSKGDLIWGNAYDPWSGDIMNDAVYSVIYNASSIDLATLAVIVDASPKTLTSADQQTYSLGAVNNSWVAVPEPATVLLFGIGGMSAWMLRRRKQQAQIEADLEE